MTTAPPAPSISTSGTSPPHIDVQFTSLNADNATLTVYRYANGTRSIVRGGKNQPVAGGLLVTDYEAPLGVPVTYSGVAADTAGIPSTEGPQPSTLTLTVTQAWLQDPIDPTSAIAINLRGSLPLLTSASLDGYSYQADASTVPVAGSPLPVGVAGVRRAASGVQLEILTYSSNDDDAIRALLAYAYPLLVRIPNRTPLLGAVYLSVNTVTENPANDGPGTVWQIVGDSVRASGVTTIINPRDWNGAQADAADWNGWVARFATWLDAQRG